MRFDGPTLAHAWLAVAAAAATERALSDLPFYKSVAIEEHPTGIRLYATDRRVLLTSWVPDLDAYYDAAPAFEDAPDRVIVARDADGRGRGLLGYVLSLAARRDNDAEMYTPGEIEIRVDFDVKLPAGTNPPAQEAFDGMDPTYTVLSVPDVEKVYLEVYQGSYPDWRHIIENHRAKATKTVSLDPEIAERLAKTRKHTGAPIKWTFGGEDKVALVAFPMSDPFVHGAVMPMRDHDTTANHDAECSQCATGLCLRHSSGVVTVNHVADATKQPSSAPVSGGAEDGTPPDHPDKVQCPMCTEWWDATEDGDACLSAAVHHLGTKHLVLDSDKALRLIHGLEQPEPGAENVRPLRKPKGDQR